MTNRTITNAMIEDFIARKGGVTRQPDFGDEELNVLYPQIRALGHSFYKATGQNANTRPWRFDDAAWGMTRRQLIARCKEILKNEEPTKI